MWESFPCLPQLEIYSDLFPIWTNIWVHWLQPANSVEKWILERVCFIGSAKVQSASKGVRIMRSDVLVEIEQIKCVSWSVRQNPKEDRAGSLRSFWRSCYFFLDCRLPVTMVAVDLCQTPLLLKLVRKAKTKMTYCIWYSLSLSLKPN